MKTKAIKNEKEYKAAMKIIESLMDLDAELGTPEGDKLKQLAILAEAYEEKRYKILPQKHKNWKNKHGEKI